MQSTTEETYQAAAFNVASSWFRQSGRDPTAVDGVSLGWSGQIELFEELYRVPSGAKPGWRGALRARGLAWPARFWASKALSVVQPWNVRPGAVALIFDVDSRPSIASLNAIAAELLSQGQRVVGVIATPGVRKQLAAGIEPVYYSGHSSPWSHLSHLARRPINVNACATELNAALEEVPSLDRDRRAHICERLKRSLRHAIFDLTALERLCAAARFSAMVSACDLHRLSAMTLQIGRRERIPTFVLQHGFPFLPYAYVPPVADTICAWGEASQRWFLDQGVADKHILITGCPRFDAHVGRPPAERHSAPSLIFLSTAVVEHKLAPAVQSFLNLPLEQFGAVTIKLHPSESSHAHYRRQIAEHGHTGRVQLEQSMPIAELISEGDIVVVGSSTSGIDAVLAGGRIADIVIEGLPSPIDYNTHGVGIRTTPTDLAAAVTRLLAQPDPEERARNRTRFLDANLALSGGAAAPRIAEAILSRLPRQQKIE